MEQPQCRSLHDLRLEIDDVDSELLQLLNQRARLGAKVYRLKRDSNLPICDPDREATVISRAQESNPGPLDSAAVASIFRQIITATRNVEERESRQSHQRGAQ